MTSSEPNGRVSSIPNTCTVMELSPAVVRVYVAVHAPFTSSVSVGTILPFTAVRVAGKFIMFMVSSPVETKLMLMDAVSPTSIPLAKPVMFRYKYDPTFALV